jgi:hypothetical protein
VAVACLLHPLQLLVAAQLPVSEQKCFLVSLLALSLPFLVAACSYKVLAAEVVIASMHVVESESKQRLHFGERSLCSGSWGPGGRASQDSRKNNKITRSLR